VRVDISLHLPAANRTSWAVEFLGNEIVQVDPKSGSVWAYSHIPSSPIQAAPDGVELAACRSRRRSFQQLYSLSACCRRKMAGAEWLAYIFAVPGEANSYLRTRQNSLKFFGMALALHLANRDIWLKH